MFLNIQMDAFSLLRSLEETTVPVDANISTYPLHSIVKPTSRNAMGDLGAYLTLTTNSSPSFVPSSSDGIRFSQDSDDFCRKIRACLGEGERIHLRLTAIASCFAPSTGLSNW